ncbi:N-acetylmuramoyl-L-alanine amidase [Paenibacillus hamazuiensis]|uniref:N-acetylmuramoyl-L-alanine amidase n=1 Tax=Paenibacillus hamazuiensis TaxID=2936508 RepID=UPI00200FFD54|nr:N-acetylmuramoyl-L-alanine amidase [Paenibacillus hamazuiensis]
MKRNRMKTAVVCTLLFAMMWFYSDKVQAADNKSAKVAVQSLNVRSKADAQSPVIGSLKRNDVVSISEESFGWVKVKSGRMTGWVAGQYLQRMSAGSTDKQSGAAARSSQTGKAETKKQKSVQSGLKGKVIVIDPGHGGNDSGVIGKKYGSMEKTLNLSTSRYLADMLRQAGAKVVMTRTDDKEQPELSERVAVSERNRADAFVSIHYNSSLKSNSGTLTFYYSESKDLTLSRKIESRLRQITGLKSSGISHGNYHVLRENDRPSTLVELGFLSNPKDEAVVRTSDYQKKAAEAIAAGLKDYFKL